MITISSKKNKIRDLICLGLVLCICLSVVMAPKAQAISELVIVGAIALTLGAVAAVVILAAEPLGLKEPIMAAAQHGFQSPREFVADMLDRYGASQGLQRFVLLDRFQKGLMITAAGKVLIDNVVSDLLTDFYHWAWSDTLSDFWQPPLSGPDIIDISQVAGLGLSAATNIMYLPGYAELPINNPTHIYSATGNTIFVGWNYTRAGFKKAHITALSDVNTNYFTNYDISGGTSTDAAINTAISGTVNGVRYTFYKLGRTYAYTNGYVDGLTNVDTLSDSFLFKCAYAYYYGDVVGGDVIDPGYEEDALVLPAPSMSNVLDVPSAMTLPAPISGTTTATQYLEAAADAITAGTGSLEYEDAYGNAQTGTLEGTGEVGLTQVGAQSAELEGAIDIADSVGSETLDNYTIDLRSFFPFCIPFDLRDMLHLLESAPAPVSIEWQFDFGDLGEYEMEINLEEWNSVAQTLRTMELLAFCFGLAMLTKRILMGS